MKTRLIILGTFFLLLISCNDKEMEGVPHAIVYVIENTYDNIGIRYVDKYTFKEEDVYWFEIQPYISETSRMWDLYNEDGYLIGKGSIGGWVFGEHWSCGFEDFSNEAVFQCHIWNSDDKWLK